MNEFRAAIQRKIDETGISMAELSRKSEVARPYLYRILDGEHVPSLEVADKIARALGLHLEISEKVG